MDDSGELFALNDKFSQLAILSQHQIEIIDLNTGTKRNPFTVVMDERKNVDCVGPEQGSDVVTGDCIQEEYQIYLSPNSAFLRNSNC